MPVPLTLLLVAALAAPFVAPSPAVARRKPITLRLPTFEVPARSNREICTFVPLPMRKAMDVAEVVLMNQGGTSTFGTHHLIVYAYKGGLDALAQYEGQVVDDTACLNFGPGDTTALQLIATSQLIESRQRSPKGTALRLEPGTLAGGKAIGLVVNSHWINGGDSPQQARVALKLVPARSRRAVKRQLKPIFEVVANGFIKVPPGETTNVKYTWGPGQLSLGAILGGVDNPKGPACVSMITGHMHRRGTLFTADLVTASGRRRLYMNTSYGEPPMLDLLPPLLVKPGEVIEYACTHDNATDPKLGCEEQDGVPPGRAVAETFPFLTLGLAAKGCLAEGPDPAGCPPTDPKYPGRTFTGDCVKANLVFGFTSEDDMCILPGYYFDPAKDGSCKL